MVSFICSFVRSCFCAPITILPKAEMSRAEAELCQMVFMTHGAVSVLFQVGARLQTGNEAMYNTVTCT